MPFADVTLGIAQLDYALRARVRRAAETEYSL
jgi:hypothetical protein